MKQGRKLFRNEKEVLRKHHLNPEDYVFLCDSIQPDGRPTSYFKIQHKETGVIKVVSRI